MHRSFQISTIIFIVTRLRFFVSSDPKFPLDFDDTDFYLTSRKGGPPSAVIEDIRRGQEGVLVKLRQVTDELENDELKLNNIFYKLGHHDTELKTVNSGIERLSASSRKTETKLNKHAFNVEFLHRQLKELEQKLNEQKTESSKITSLQNTIDHLEDRLSAAIYRLASIEGHGGNNSKAKTLSLDKTKNSVYEYSAEPSLVLNYQVKDQSACPSDWSLIDDSCYYVSSDKKTFQQSISSCALLGASLLSLTESKKLSLSKITNSDTQHWTSATDIFIPTLWTFLMTGEEVPRNMWTEASRGHAMSRKGNHCAIFSSQGLEAVKCGHKVHYICERLH